MLLHCSLLMQQLCLDLVRLTRFCVSRTIPYPSKKKKVARAFLFFVWQHFQLSVLELWMHRVGILCARSFCRSIVTHLFFFFSSEFFVCSLVFSLLYLHYLRREKKKKLTFWATHHRLCLFMYVVWVKDRLTNFLLSVVCYFLFSFTEDYRVCLCSSSLIFPVSVVFIWFNNYNIIILIIIIIIFCIVHYVIDSCWIVKKVTRCSQLVDIFFYSPSPWFSLSYRGIENSSFWCSFPFFFFNWLPYSSC